MRPFADHSTGTFPLVACIFLTLAAADGAALGDAEKDKDAKAPAPAAGKALEKAEKAEEAPEVRGLAMLPVGKTNLGVRLPVFEGAKQTMLFKAAEMTPKDKEEVDMTGVEILILNDMGTDDTRIVMTSSSYLVPLGLLSSDEKTVIHGSDYTLTGATLDFDTKKKYGVMRGPVRMILRDFDKLRGGGENGKVLQEGVEEGADTKPVAETKPETDKQNEAISPERPKP